MDRRKTLKLIGGAAAMAGAGFPGLTFAEAQEMVTVVKIAGIPWFNALERGSRKARRISASMPRWLARRTSIRHSRSSCLRT